MICFQNALEIKVPIQLAPAIKRKKVISQVVTVAKFQGGGAFNVIPDSVTIGGTFRAFSKESFLQLKQRIEEVCFLTFLFFFFLFFLQPPSNDRMSNYDVFLTYIYIYIYMHQFM